MKGKLLHALMVVGLVLAGSAVSAAPAAASDGDGAICVLNQNTWLRDAPHGFVLRTLSAGRGFRWHGSAYDIGTGVMWYYGHGAEAPAQDGWVPRDNSPAATGRSKRDGSTPAETTCRKVVSAGFSIARCRLCALSQALDHRHVKE